MTTPVHPFSLSLSTQQNQPGAWNSTVVDVLSAGEKIGSYTRNYPSHAEKTFAPFQTPTGKWLALYSQNYTATRLMSLPDCQDLGGETPQAYGFCPVELYIPHYRVFTYDFTRQDGTVVRFDAVVWDRPEDAEETAEYEAIMACHTAGKPLPDGSSDYKNPDFTPWTACPFAFVAGCVWGDDSSWKIEMFDLSRADEGIITRFAPFGYAELPHGMSLKDAVDLSDWRTTSNWLRLTTMATHKFTLGVSADPAA